MTDEYTFTLPVPPSANEYWGVSGSRMYVTEKAKAYKQEIKYMLSQAVPMKGFVAVNFSVYRPRMKGDLDNYNKIMFDALQGLVYENDNQIVEIHSFREDDKENPRVIIYIYERQENGV